MQTVRLILVVTLLVGVDLIGSVAIKEAGLRRSPALAFVGVLAFVCLALVLYLALQYAELTLVSLCWIVLVQVGVMLVDHFLYGVTPGNVQLLAIGVALVALGVALLAPTREPAQPLAPPRVPEQRTYLSLEERLQERMAIKRANGGRDPYRAPDVHIPGPRRHSLGG